MSSTQRRWKRLKVDFRVRFRLESEPEESGKLVRSYELSEGGMSVYLPETIPVGTKVVVSFALVGDNTLRLRAVVRSLRGFRVGMEFLDLAPDQRFEVLRYLGSVASAEKGKPGQ